MFGFGGLWVLSVDRGRRIQCMRFGGRCIGHTRELRYWGHLDRENRCTVQQYCTDSCKRPLAMRILSQSSKRALGSTSCNEVHVHMGISQYYPYIFPNKDPHNPSIIPIYPLASLAYPLFEKPPYVQAPLGFMH